MMNTTQAERANVMLAQAIAYRLNVTQASVIITMWAELDRKGLLGKPMSQHAEYLLLCDWVKGDRDGT